MFWEKRLEGLKACDSDGSELESLDPPRGVEPVGPHVANDTVLQSVATALHVNGQPITGQTGNRVNLDTNPGVYVNPDQPLIQVTQSLDMNIILKISNLIQYHCVIFLQALSVQEDDIRSQEEKVMEARKKLEEAIRSFDE